MLLLLPPSIIAVEFWDYLKARNRLILNLLISNSCRRPLIYSRPHSERSIQAPILSSWPLLIRVPTQLGLTPLPRVVDQILDGPIHDLKESLVLVKLVQLASQVTICQETEGHVVGIFDLGLMNPPLDVSISQRILVGRIIIYRCHLIFILDILDGSSDEAARAEHRFEDRYERVLVLDYGVNDLMRIDVLNRGGLIQICCFIHH